MWIDYVRRRVAAYPMRETRSSGPRWPDLKKYYYRNFLVCVLALTTCFRSTHGDMGYPLTGPGCLDFRKTRVERVNSSVIAAVG